MTDLIFEYRVKRPGLATLSEDPDALRCEFSGEVRVPGPCVNKAKTLKGVRMFVHRRFPPPWKVLSVKWKRPAD